MTDADNTENVRQALENVSNHLAFQARRVDEVRASDRVTKPMDDHEAALWGERILRTLRAMEVVSEEIHGMQQEAN